MAGMRLEEWRFGSSEASSATDSSHLFLREASFLADMDACRSQACLFLFTRLSVDGVVL